MVRNEFPRAPGIQTEKNVQPQADSRDASGGKEERSLKHSRLSSSYNPSQSILTQRHSLPPLSNILDLPDSYSTVVLYQSQDTRGCVKCHQCTLLHTPSSPHAVALHVFFSIFVHTQLWKNRAKLGTPIKDPNEGEKQRRRHLSADREKTSHGHASFRVHSLSVWAHCRSRPKHVIHARTNINKLARPLSVLPCPITRRKTQQRGNKSRHRVITWSTK